MSVEEHARTILAGVDGSGGAPDARVLEEQSAAAGLLVVGSRGYGPARAVLLGSVSHAVVRNARWPVVVVPRSEDDVAPSRPRKQSEMRLP